MHARSHFARATKGTNQQLPHNTSRKTRSPWVMCFFCLFLSRRWHLVPPASQPASQLLHYATQILLMWILLKHTFHIRNQQQQPQTNTKSQNHKILPIFFLFRSHGAVNINIIFHYLTASLSFAFSLTGWPSCMRVAGRARIILEMEIWIEKWSDWSDWIIIVDFGWFNIQNGVSRGILRFNHIGAFNGDWCDYTWKCTKFNENERPCTSLDQIRLIWRD